ncbi:TetR/AcrR family transcriptional regulator [Chitinimonas lacunae]|uniref:TetR/AcrR family transcriptional regulator n=1 Tax=Chitinimonas lacunae TaxID=1963018 RepID=A0ABV8MSK3_9NEIS
MRWTRRKEARPGEILDAALDLFVAKGFAATKMEDIARRAGVTAGTLYRYYANKEEIFKAVIRESLVPQLDEGEQLLSGFTGQTSAAELLEMVIRTWWRLIGATRLSGIPKLVIAEASNFPELARYHREQVIERGEKLIGRAIEYGIARGEFRPMRLEVAVRVICAPVVMAMLWKHSMPQCGEEFEPEPYLDEVIRTLVQGLAATPSP